MNLTEFQTYRGLFENEIRGNILPYWMKFAVEKDSGGFFGAVDMDNQPVLTANKSCVLNTRILWAFSAAAGFFDDKSYADMAERAFRVVIDHFYDRQYGGFFMELTPGNAVASEVKHTYAQAFAVYALCKYYEFNPSPGVLAIIQKTFADIEGSTKDPRHPGYGEAFTRGWQSLPENRMADHNEPRSMNTHLHLLEAYAALYKIWPDGNVKLRLAELLNLFLDRIIRPTGHLGVFFDLDFDEVPASQGTCSFGHDIEASWLLWEAAEILGDASLAARLRPVCLKMLDAVDRDGVDKNGGLFLESTRFGSHLRTNKHWWPQAENLVGFMNGFELTRDSHYWESVKLTWAFIDRHVIDHQGGEWFTKVNRLGEPYRIEPLDDPSPYYRNDWKVDPWKCPYHNGRACLEMIRRIDRVLAAGATAKTH